MLLQATAVDRHGAPVTDLDREAFTIHENGTPQRIEVFRREDVPVSIGLLIDNSASMRALRGKVEAAALAFARASNVMDELCVVNFADKVDMDVPFTSNLAELERRIARVDSVGGTALWDAFDRAEMYVSGHATRPRKVLLVITDGNDNASVARCRRLSARRNAGKSSSMQSGYSAAMPPPLHADGASWSSSRGRRAAAPSFPLTSIKSTRSCWISRGRFGTST